MSNVQANLVSIDGVWLDIVSTSGWSALERGSPSIDLIDLVKAIYIIDLEHVIQYWDDWRNYEKWVLAIRSAGRKQYYINRSQYLFTMQIAKRENAGNIIMFPPASPHLLEVGLAAERLARDRAGVDEVPSSGDILFSICSLDPPLSQELSRSGLRIEKLSADVIKRAC